MHITNLQQTILLERKSFDHKENIVIQKYNYNAIVF